MLTTRTRMKVLSELAEDGGNCGSPVVVAAADVDDDHATTAVEERRERRRRKIIEELFETEKTYLQHLNLAHKFFEFPLRYNCLISERAHAQLFSNLEQILEVNSKLLEYMEQTTVGTAFKFLGPFLKLYSMYAQDHQQASNTLQENLQKSEKFAEFVREQEDRPEVCGLKIGALLITPVQRIPRYKLLLEDLLQNTHPDHHDFHMLKEASKQVGEIALHINEHVRQNENFQKMLSIQNSFDSSAPKILAPGREFVKEGKLNKVSRKGGKSQERMFFLFSDMMIYGKPKLLDSGNSSYSCCCILPLRHCDVEKVLGSVQRTDGGGMFRINCKDESLLLYSTDPDEAVHWVDTMEAAIRKINMNRQTLRKPSSNKQPVRGKSLMKMRTKEKKQDLKRKLTGRKAKCKEVTQSALKDVSNCLTPPKRQRRGSIDSTDTPSTSSNYEERNEINLDNWSPSALRNDDDDDQEPTNDIHTISEAAEYDDDDDNIPAIVIENPPYPESLGDLELRDDLDLDDLDSVTHSNRSSYRNSVNEEVDYSSQPWINPKFRTEKESTGSCSTWPIRKVIQSGSKMTSSIGDMMDNVRHNKRCTIM